MDCAGFVAHRGGIASASALVVAGATRRALTASVRDGSLRRPRQGWYSTLATGHPRFRAVRIGGRLTGASALADMGAWMLHRPARVEVAVPRGSARLRPDPRAIIHWVDDRATPASDAVVGLPEALVRVVLDHDLEISVPCFDWALHTGRLDRPAFERVLRAMPGAARSMRQWADPDSESLIESLARVRLMRLGLPVRSQVPIGGRSAIDLVVADTVALELDGREHHESTFESDRRKDLRITTRGRHAIRVSYWMLVDDWPAVERAVLCALSARGRGGAQDSVIPPREPRGTRHSPGAGRVDD